MLDKFEKIVRASRPFARSSRVSAEMHPFDERNIHPEIATITSKLFDDGHYAQATFEAYKYIDKRVQNLSGESDSGYKLMMKAFSETLPLIKLTPLITTSEIDEQKGFQFIFAGSVMAIRNPRGHEYSIPETLDQCLDNLSLASLLMRRLDHHV